MAQTVLCKPHVDRVDSFCGTAVRQEFRHFRKQFVEGSEAFVTVPEYDYGFTIGEEAGKWIKENWMAKLR